MLLFKFHFTTAFLFTILAFAQARSHSSSSSSTSKSSASHHSSVNSTSATSVYDFSSLPTPIVPTNGVAQEPTLYESSRGLSCPGYQARNISEYSYGVLAILELAGDACYAYGTDYPYLLLNVSYDTEERVHISISDLNQTQFQLSNRRDVWDAPLFYRSSNFSGNLQYNFSFNTDPFEFWITRIADDQVLFDTRGNPLIFEDQYIELTTNMVEDYNVYGLSGSQQSFRLGNNLTKTFWATGYSDSPEASMYGSHPFYMEQRYIPIGTTNTYTSASHGVLMLSSNGMEVLLRSTYIKYRMIGGIIDLFVYSGSTVSPKYTIQQYVQSIGTPTMQPYWSLGFQMSRWGYKTLSDLINMRSYLNASNIPTEGFWNDIDYMSEFRTFTVNSTAFPPNQTVDFFRSLDESHQHYVPVLDPAIYAANPNKSADRTYYPYYSGFEDNIFIKNPNGSAYVGMAWPGFVVYPDFTNPAVLQYWKQGILNLSTAFGSNYSYDLPFSGLCLDMNEPTSFCIGSCGSDLLKLNPVHPPFSLPGDVDNKVYSYPEDFNATNTTEYKSVSRASQSQYKATATSEKSHETPSSESLINGKPEFSINYPPYALDTDTETHDLAQFGVSPNATMHGNTLRYNLFNTYGYSESKISFEALNSIQPNIRPFLLSRSTFVGSGRYAAHWLGDNKSQWSDMVSSISSILTFNLLGIPMVGADVCGYNGNTDEELCARWMALGAFLPFYRNHNSLGSIPQEPFRWASVAEASRSAIEIRYSLLPYWYTLMHTASVDGTPMVRPLFFEFPKQISLASVDKQFMIGTALLISPALEPNTTYIQGIIPGDNDTIWYDWYNHSVINHDYDENITMSAPLGYVNIAVRGGNIIPLQQPGYTTYESRNNPYSLLIAMDNNGFASGSLYIDDGISMQTNSSLSVKLNSNSNTITCVVSGTMVSSPSLANITILGLSNPPNTILFNGQQLSDYQYSDQTLSLTNLQDLTVDGAFSKNWTVTWS
ncbi:Alpha-glucosidase Agl1 [Schizosaccharomyces pombe]